MSPTPTRRVLVIDDDDSLRQALTTLLTHSGFAVLAAATGEEAVAAVRQEPVDLALLDLRLGDESGLDLLPRLKKIRPDMSIIMITALGTIESAVEAMKLGADNYLTKPIDPGSLLALVTKGLETRVLRRRSNQFERISRAPAAPAAIGRSPAMRRVLDLAQSVAPRSTSVLLLGATGTGKGLLARHIHDQSPRKNEPFVELNCAGLAKDLVESELFGHEKGSFSGAVERKIGLFEAADGGTLFLDEIGEMELAVQSKLLKVLESSRFRRLGGLAEIEVDVRVLAATHRNLPSDITSGRFREDLYYRLAVFEIGLPRLADRGEDLIDLAESFARKMRSPGDEAEPPLTEAAIELIESYSWPGNVRELRNVMERGAILARPGAPIGLTELPPLRHAALNRAAAEDDPRTEESSSLGDMEKAALEKALRDNDGNIQATARALGISRGAVYRKVKKHGLAVEETQGGNLVEE